LNAQIDRAAQASFLLRRKEEEAKREEGKSLRDDAPEGRASTPVAIIPNPGWRIAAEGEDEGATLLLLRVTALIATTAPLMPLDTKGAAPLACGTNVDRIFVERKREKERRRRRRRRRSNRVSTRCLLPLAE
jgi:hypothetical protein